MIKSQVQRQNINEPKSITTNFRNKIIETKTKTKQQKKTKPPTAESRNRETEDLRKERERRNQINTTKKSKRK